jgi:hypothetical protein
MYAQGSPAELLTPTQWNLIGHRATASVIDQQYSSTTFVSLHPHSSKRKLGARFKNILSFNLVF